MSEIRSELARLWREVRGENVEEGVNSS